MFEDISDVIYTTRGSNKKHIARVEAKLDALLSVLKVVVDKDGVVTSDGYTSHTHDYDNNGTAATTDDVNN